MFHSQGYFWIKGYWTTEDYLVLQCIYVVCGCNMLPRHFRDAQAGAQQFRQTLWWWLWVTVPLTCGTPWKGATHSTLPLFWLVLRLSWNVTWGSLVHLTTSFALQPHLFCRVRTQGTDLTEETNSSITLLYCLYLARYDHSHDSGFLCWACQNSTLLIYGWTLSALPRWTSAW